VVSGTGRETKRDKSGVMIVLGKSDLAPVPYFQASSPHTAPGDDDVRRSIFMQDDPVSFVSYRLVLAREL
jgi:hypothetical protein